MIRKKLWSFVGALFTGTLVVAMVCTDPVQADAATFEELYSQDSPDFTSTENYDYSGIWKGEETKQTTDTTIYDEKVKYPALTVKYYDMYFKLTSDGHAIRIKKPKKGKITKIKKMGKVVELKGKYYKKGPNGTGFKQIKKSQRNKFKYFTGRHFNPDNPDVSITVPDDILLNGGTGMYIPYKGYLYWVV